MRQRNRHRIQQLHGTIQLLDVAYPVDIDRLYVDVNVLSEPTSYNHSEIDDLLQNSNPKKNVESTDLHLAIKAVENHQKLIVLGKPGAGKSTFSQHVVIECNKGNLLKERVPILIKLRDYVRKARREENHNLKFHICSYLKSCSQQEAETLLDEGKVLLLLDGLDEVPEANVDRVIDEIDYLVEDNPLIYIIITCRLQGNKYKFNGFTYVEISDFQEYQITAFTENWFAASYNNDWERGKAKAHKFMSQLKLPENKQILELVTTPLLLSLVCKIFSAKHQFYSKRHKLYEQGLEILLSKWDESRRIRRERLYQDLNLEEKVKLLSYIATRKFEQEQYVLFEKSEIQGYISEHLGISEEDSQVILESIIKQHGLLIERAQSIYSFSHLTFQEYFVAQKIVSSGSIENLVQNINKKYWHDIFIYVSEMLRNTEEFLRQIKQAIDKQIIPNKKIKYLFQWIVNKSNNINSLHKPVAIRAFYFINAFDIILKTEQAVGKISNVINDLAILEGLDVEEILETILNENIEIDPEIIIDRSLTIALVLANDILISNNRLVSILNQSLLDILKHSIELALDFNIRLQEDLQLLRGELPVCSQDFLQNWWFANGQDWIEKFRTIMIKHRNIGYNWQFKEDQALWLLKYCEANLLLVKCLKASLPLSQRIINEIEENLLKPKI